MRLKGEVKLTLGHAESSSGSEDDTTQSVFVSIDAMRLNSTAEKYHHFVFLFKSRHSLVLRSASSSFAIRSRAPAHLAVWLRDVGYGVAYFQTCPVDGPCHSKQSEEDQQRPRNVDSFGVLGRLPRADLAERKRCGTQKMVGTCREIFTHTHADTHTHHKSCSGGDKDNEEQEAQQAPLPGVRPANGGAGHKQQKYSDQESLSSRTQAGVKELTLSGSVDIGPTSCPKSPSTGKKKKERELICSRSTHCVKVIRREQTAVSCGLVSHQEYVGTVTTDDPDAHGLMLRLRTLPADVNWTQVDDAFAGKKTKMMESHVNRCKNCLLFIVFWNILLKPFMSSYNGLLPPSSGQTVE